MKKQNWTKLISVLLVMATLLTALPITVFADSFDNPAASANEVYIKDVKLSQSKSRDEAKKMLEEEGYIFLDRNLNEGTGADGVWLGYTTTTDPNEAIYDMKLMNTKGGYTLTSMEAVLESQKSTFAQMAKELNDLIEEFTEAYKAGSVSAQKAYKALNFFRVVEGETVLEEENGLGYQFVNGKFSIEKLTELILFADAMILDTIVKTLAMGIQLTAGNWMEELSKIGPYDSEKKYAENETELKRRAKQLLVVFKLYAQTYNAMDAMGLFKDDKSNNSGTEGEGGDKATAEQKEMANLDIARVEVYRVIFEDFEKYTYGNGTLKDFVVSLEKETNEKALYPLVSCLTDGEFSAFSYGCFIEMALGATTTRSDFDRYDEEFANATKDVKPFYIYEGVNPVLLKDSTVVAFTDEASRRMSLTGEYQFYEKENWGEDFYENRRYDAMKIEVAGMVVMSAAKGILGMMSVTGVLATATAKGATGILVGVAKVCAFLGSGTFQLIVFLVAAAVALIGYIVCCIYESWNNTVDWSKNPIPQYMYDIKDVGFASSSSDGITTEYMQRTAYVFYEVVTDIRNKPVDLNARSSDASQWIALYVSRDRPGDDSKPIKAEDLKVAYGNGETPNGYTPVTRFGEVRAYNLNQWDDDDAVNGIFMFFKQDKNTSVKSDRKYYIQDVVLQAGESDAHCISLLEAAGFTPININLSPDYRETGIFSSKKVFTYLGYKLTENSADALTDIRIEYGNGAATKQYGGITYASSGSSAGVTLYATKYSEAGTPIMAGLMVVNDRSEAPIGFEPVNFFAGGPAASFNLEPEGIYIDTTEYLLYFLPETTFTSGEVYLGGLGYYYSTEFAMTKWAGEGNYREIVLDYLKKTLGKDYPVNTNEERKKAINDYVFLKSGYHYTTSSEGIFADSVIYYATYNPYRAIYNITGSNFDSIPGSFTFDGSGYSVWNSVWWFGIQYESSEYIRNEFTYRYNNQGVSYRLTMNGDFYVSGNPSKDNIHDEKNGGMTNVQPLKIKDVVILKTSDDASALKGEDSAYNPVVDIFSTSKDPVAVKQTDSKNEFVIYTTNAAEEKPYISSISVVDKLTIFRALGGIDSGIKRSQVTDGMLMAQLASNGATYFSDLSTKMYSKTSFNKVVTELNTMKFGYTRTDDIDKALRDIFIYFDGFNTDAPPAELYRGNVKYTLVCEIPYNLTGYEEAPRAAVYVYGTTDTRAGKPITDIEFSKTPFVDGYVAARTQNGRSLWSEMADYFKKNQEHYFFSWGLDWSGAYKLFEKLYNYFNVNRVTDTIHENEKDSYAGHYQKYFYILTKHEGYDLRAEKPYITELYLPTKDVSDAPIFGGDLYTEIRMCETVFDQGADEIVNVNLYYPGTEDDPIYLGYKRTADPKEAITEIRVEHTDNREPSKIVYMASGVVYQLVSDYSRNFNNSFRPRNFYFYYTKSQNPDVGSPISDIIFTLNRVPSYYVTDSAEVLPVMRWDKWQPSNLNEGYETSLYLSVVRPFDRPMGTYEENFGTRKPVTRYNTSGKAEGAYIAALYVMDKNTIRQEKLAQGVPSDQCTCDMITNQEVFDRLKAMGATTIIETPICLKEEYYKGNTNDVFIGYSRTDKLSLAIKHIIIQTTVASTREPAETITIDKINYDIVAEGAKKVQKLPSAINLIGTQDSQNIVGPRMYLYTSTEGKTEPVYDICIDSDPLKNNWLTVRSESGLDPFYDIYLDANEQVGFSYDDVKNSSAEELVYSSQMNQWMSQIRGMFDPEDRDVTPFYIHTKMYEGKSIEDTLPYISELFIAEGDSKNHALAKLVAYEPDGFIDYDINGGTWFGKNIFIAYKRTANSSDAIRELVVFTGKNPAESKRLTIKGVSVRFDLVANVDLNSGAGGDWLYLYSTTNGAAGEPIKSLRVSNEIVNRVSGGGFTEFTTRRANDSGFTDQDPDLNDGAGGDYIYLVAMRDVNKADYPAWMFGGALFGSGSIRTLFVLAGVAAVVAVFVYSRKKETETAEEKKA